LGAKRKPVHNVGSTFSLLQKNSFLVSTQLELTRTFSMLIVMYDALQAKVSKFPQVSSNSQKVDVGCCHPNNAAAVVSSI
jgi:hypothetical protein